MTFFSPCGTGHHPFCVLRDFTVIIQLLQSSTEQHGCDFSHWVVSQFLSIFFPFLNVCVCASFTCKWVSHWLPLHVGTFRSSEKLNAFSKDRAGPKVTRCYQLASLPSIRSLEGQGIYQWFFFLSDTYPPALLVFSFVMGSSPSGWGCTLGLKMSFASVPLCSYHRCRGMWNW